SRAQYTGDVSCLLSYLSLSLFLAMSFFFFNDTATTEIYTLSLHDALPISDRQHGLPRLASVGGLVQPAVAARPPQRPLSRDINHVRIARIDENLADVFRFFQADLSPTLASIIGAVHAVAVTDAALAVVFSRTHPGYLCVL